MTIEERILGALELFEELILEGVSPREAVERCAQEFDLKERAVALRAKRAFESKDAILTRHSLRSAASQRKLDIKETTKRFCIYHFSDKLPKKVYNLRNVLIRKFGYLSTDEWRDAFEIFDSEYLEATKNYPDRFSYYHYGQ